MRAYQLLYCHSNQSPLTQLAKCTDVSALMVFGIVHSAPFHDCLQVCHVACRAAERSMLAFMAALSLAALLLMSLQHKRIVIVDSLHVPKH